MTIETVTVAEIIAAARARHASLVAESAGHLVLGLAPSFAGVPAHVDVEHVVLNSEGSVSLHGPVRAAGPKPAVEGVRKLLAAMLRVSHGTAIALRSLAEPPGNRAADLVTFFDELAAALIPINRGAAKRALARLARETLRAKARGHLERTEVPALDHPTPTEVDAVLVAEHEAEQLSPAPISAEADLEPSEPSPSEEIVVVCDSPFDIEYATEPPLGASSPASRSERAAAVESAIEEEESIDPPSVSVALDFLTRSPSPSALAAPERHGAPAAPEPAVDGPAVDDRISEVSPLLEVELEPVSSRAPSPAEPHPAPAWYASPAPPSVSPAPLSVELADEDLDELDAAPDSPAPEALAEDDEAPEGIVAAPHSPAPEPVAEVAEDDEDDEAPEGIVAAPRSPAPEPIAEVAEDDEDDEAPEGIVAAPHSPAPEPVAEVAEDDEAPEEIVAAPHSSAPEPVAEDDEAPEEIVAAPDTPAPAPVADVAENDEAREELDATLDTPTPAPVAGDDAPFGELVAEAVGALDELDEALDEIVATPGSTAPEIVAEADARTDEPVIEADARTDEMVAEADARAPAPSPAPSATAPPTLAASTLVVEYDTAEPEDAALAQDATAAPDGETDEDEDEPNEELTVPLDLEVMAAASPSGEPDAGAASPGPAETESSDDASEPAEVATPTPRRPAAEPSPTPLPKHARTVESLLDEFGESPSGAPSALQQAALSLRRLAQLVTPRPPETSPEPAGPSPSPSPVAGLTLPDDPSDPPSIPPQSYLPSPLRTPRTTLRVSAGLLLLGLAAVAFTWVRYPAFFAGSSSPLAGGGQEPAAAEGAVPAARPACLASVHLTDLPSPHEVLQRLGTTPLTTRPLPRGVRLELIATAPGHQSQRIIVPADAAWQSRPSGSQVLPLEIQLEQGLGVGWPGAPAGTVGGQGPEGNIELSASPPSAEIWMVSAVGHGRRQTVTLPCEAPAHLLVVQPDAPANRRRLTIQPEVLQAAAETGGTELGVFP